MTVADDVTLDDLILAKDDLSGADIKVGIKSIDVLLVHLESDTPDGAFPKILFGFTSRILQRMMA